VGEFKTMSNGKESSNDYQTSCQATRFQIQETVESINKILEIPVNGLANYRLGKQNSK
jgi:hypothetical protein